MSARRTGWIVAAISAATITAAAAQEAQQANDKAEQILNASCTTCHDLRPIETSALDKEGWRKDVDAMIEKGADVKPDDRPLLIDYLVKNHGPLPEGPGKTVVLNVCTMCHDLSRVRRPGATPEEWQEILLAMLNEGAPLTEQDFPVVLGY